MKLDKSYVGYCLSEGTLREVDLLNSFGWFAENNLDPATRTTMLELVKEAQKLLLEGDPNGEVSMIINDEIWAIMNEVAPEGTMFGASEGDGACFGYWSYDEE